MDRGTGFAAAILCFGLALPVVAATPDAAVADAAAPCSAEERQTFDQLYADRIQKARRAEDKAALATEMLAGAGSAPPGLKYLMLASAADLAQRGRNADVALTAQTQLVDLGLGDPTALRARLLDLQINRFNELARAARSHAEAKRLLHDLGNRLVETALTLVQAHRGAFDFTAAIRAGTKALKPATLIQSDRLPLLRQSIAIDEQLTRLVSMAKGHEARGKADVAMAEYLDAGLIPDATRLLAAHPDDDTALLVRVATATAPDPADVVAAARVWDGRATDAKGPLETIRLLRAADLYEQFMACGEGLDLNAANIRLQAIQKRLGDLLGSLRKATEWVYLAETPHEAASVGWGALKKVTRKDKPCAIVGRRFATGLYAHASSKIVYALKGQYKQFSFCYGMGTGAGGAAWFEVRCDGKQAWKSGGMWSNHTHGVRKPTVLSIAGVQKLELVAHGIAGGSGAHAWWGDPKVR